MSVSKIESEAQFDALLNSGKVVFVDFYADWCGPCKQISPTYQKLAGENAKDGVEFYKVDTDQLPDVSEKAGIRSIPAFHVYKNGQRIDEVVGAKRDALATLIQARSVL
ncbi:thioredoxin-like protein [Butyriboletus roseoflavus]|nr:thioredoxin-like protein [Butyriboletus roseoflavus]